MTSFRLTVAGESVTVRAHQLEEYTRRAGTARTLRLYDGRAIADPQGLTTDDIAATRVIRSRISNAQAAWFVRRARNAPWDLVPTGSRLVDADPADPASLYWQAAELYAYFRDDAPRGVAMGKLHKALHMVRRDFFPIFDAHLQQRYRQASRDVAQTTGSNYGRLWWAAVRRDLLVGTTVKGLSEIRAWATERGAPVAGLGTLSDVRLLDIVTWEQSRNG